MAKKLQVLVAIVFFEDLLNVVGDLRNSRRSRGAEDRLQPLVKFTLEPRVSSGGGSRTRQQAFCQGIATILFWFWFKISSDWTSSTKPCGLKWLKRTCSAGNTSSVVWSWSGTAPLFAWSPSLPSSVRFVWICGGFLSSPSKPAAQSLCPKCRADGASPRPTREPSCPLQLGVNFPESLEKDTT